MKKTQKKNTAKSKALEQLGATSKTGISTKLKVTVPVKVKSTATTHLVRVPSFTSEIYYIIEGKLVIHHLGLMKFITNVLGVRRVKNQTPCEYVQIRSRRVTPINRENDIIPMVMKYVEQYYPVDLGDGFKKKDLLNKLAIGVDIYFSHRKYLFIDEIEIAPTKDKKDCMHFYFRNKFVKVTVSGVSVHEYSELKHNIWESQVIQRNIVFPASTTCTSVFSQFLFNISDGNASRYECAQTTIGYLLHNHKDRGNCPAVVLMDEEVAEEGEANGGTGKGIFTMAISSMTHFLHKEAQGFKFGHQFSFQDVTPFQQVIIFDDASPYFPFQKLFGIITNVINVERKHRDVMTIPFENIPKILISTNYVMLAPNGPSTERRKVELEFAPYYTLKRTPAMEFGHRLFDEWDAEEWNRFHSFMFECCQLYLKKGLLQHPSINREVRKMEVRVTKQLMEFIDGVLIKQKEKPGVFNFTKKTQMTRFLREYPHMRTKFTSQNIFTKRTKEYLKSLGFEPIDTPKETRANIQIEIQKPVSAIAA